MPVRLSSTQGLVGRPLSSRPKDQMATTHPTASERLAKPALPVSPWRTEASRPGAGRRRPGETMRRENSLRAADRGVVEARLLLRPMVPGVIRAKRVEAGTIGVQDGGSTPPTSMILGGGSPSLVPRPVAAWFATTLPGDADARPAQSFSSHRLVSLQRRSAIHQGDCHGSDNLQGGDGWPFSRRPDKPTRDSGPPVKLGMARPLLAGCRAGGSLPVDKTSPPRMIRA